MLVAAKALGVVALVVATATPNLSQAEDGRRRGGGSVGTGRSGVERGGPRSDTSVPTGRRTVERREHRGGGSSSDRGHGHIGHRPPPRHTPPPHIVRRPAPAPRDRVVIVDRTPPHYPRHPGPHDDTYAYSEITCAPETAENNMAKADGVLSQLASTELANAETFKVRAGDLMQMPMSREKADAYMKLVGIKNPNDGVEIMNFLYAREIDAQYVQSVSDNLQLTSDQAKLLVQKMTEALKPRQ